MSQSRTDAEIIQASLETPESFEVIFDRHYAGFHRFLVAAVGPTNGPDLASEVFLRAFATRDRFRIEYSSARPWLRGIAANLIRGYFRSRARGDRAYRRVAPPSNIQLDPSEDSVIKVVAESERPVLEAAMGRLRREDAEVLLLFAVADLSYAEIAEALGIAEGTVRSRLSRTRIKLRNLIGPNGELETDD